MSDRTTSAGTAAPTASALANLEQSDLIFLADGAQHEAAWREMQDGADAIAERIRWRYYQGAVLLGVGSGASCSEPTLSPSSIYI